MSTQSVDMGTEQDVNRLVAEACGLRIAAPTSLANVPPCIRWNRKNHWWDLHLPQMSTTLRWIPIGNIQTAIWAALRIGQVTTTHRIDGSVTATLEVDEGGGHRQIFRGESDYSGASAVCLAILAWHQRESTR